MDNLLRPDVDILHCEHCVVRRWDYSGVIAPYWRLYWNGRKGAVLTAQGAEIRMGPESLVLVPANTRFSTRSAAAFPHLYIHFRAGDPYTRVRARVRAFPVDAAVARRIRLLVDSLALPDRDSWRAGLMAHLLVFDGLLMLKDDDFERPRSLDPRVRAAVDMLDRETSRIVPNEELGDGAGMTVTGFIRLFTREVGVSPQQYSRRKRIDKAALLLHFTGKKMDEIAQETGFFDRYHFTRVFTRLLGTPPAAFRRQKDLTGR